MPLVPLARSDVIHLHSQLAAATKRKLDLYLPNADPDDSLKQRVNVHVEEFILELFGALDGNVSIVDGNSDQSGSLRDILANKQLTQTEPFDFNLAEQVRKLWIQVEEETVKLTALRKKGPVDAKQLYEDSFDEVLKSVLAQDDENEEAEVDRETEQEQIRELQRLEDIKDTYNGTIDTVLKIKQSIPNQRNELVKIEKIAKFLSEK